MSHAIVTRSEVPVVVVKEDDPTEGDVVVGVDGRPDGRRALSWAATEARLRGVAVRAVMAWGWNYPQGVHGTEPALRGEAYDGRAAIAVLDTIITEVLGVDHELDIQPVACHQLPARALVERSADAGLVVVALRPGSVARHLEASSVALQVLHHATSPVAVVPPPPAA